MRRRRRRSMTMRNKFLALFAALQIFASPAFAASGLTQIQVKDGNGTLRTMNVTSDTGAITGNLEWNNAICDVTTLTQCAAVSSAGALSSNVTALGGTSLAAATAWGTAPSGNVLNANVNIQGCATSVCNSNGQTTMSASAPVTLASDQSVADPCTFKLKSYASISLTAS